jgi:2-polyprenyl-3-methyl-5-hydroxy-6-metoxy-1,4-benzoquinol methylase
MKLIDRKNCVLTNENDLQHLYTFKKFPIFMGCTENDIDTDIAVDMNWSISKNTGIVQLKKLIPLDILYENSHGSGSVGELWDRHHSDFSSFISQFNMNYVLEIGGSHGILANKVNIKKDIEWTVVDPNAEVKELANIHVIKKFFDDDFSSDTNFDTIIFSHLFEHIYDPNIFLKQILKIIKEGTNLIFSIPNMEKMLKNKRTNCLNFEHTLFLTEPYIEYMFNLHGFSLLKKEYFLEDHSIFYAYSFDKNNNSKTLENYYIKNKILFLEYVDYYNEFIIEINKYINLTNDEIYLFGGHIFSQYLISFGLNTTNIVAILDNDKQKQNKRLYGTNLYVKSPEILADKKNVLVILCAGLYNEEIKKDILLINNNVKFLER